METDKTPPAPVEPWHKSRMLMRNPISLAGAALAIVGLANIFLFFLIDQIAVKPGPYIGILAYMVSPAFLVLGLLLMLAGILLERRKKVAPTAFYPRIDLNDPTQRSAVFSFVTFLIVFAMVSAAGSYKAYEFTESVSFCGQLCHTVMSPEYTAYQLSPARASRMRRLPRRPGRDLVREVEAVGQPAGVRHDLSHRFRARFRRPYKFASGAGNLRTVPLAKEILWRTTESLPHYANDEKNTLRQVRMIIKTGGGDPATGAPEGIHWHMNIGNKIEYVAADEKRQVIPYIHVEDLQGRVTEYYAKDSTLTKDQIKDQISKGDAHRMDCVDCHNRPTHIYVSPDLSVDQSLLARRIDNSLPFIKQEAVTVLTASYNTDDAAMQGIAGGIQEYYEEKYPDVAKSKQLEIRNAVAEVQADLQTHHLPRDEVELADASQQSWTLLLSRMLPLPRWAARQRRWPRDQPRLQPVPHPDVANRRCGQRRGGQQPRPTPQFQHPVDIGDLTQVTCSDCHTGGNGP